MLNEKNEIDKIKAAVTLVVVGVLAVILILLARSIWSLNETLQKNTAVINTAKEAPGLPKPVIKPSIPDVLFNLSGLIKEHGGSFLMMEADIPSMLESGQVAREKEIRRVLVNTETKVSRLNIITDQQTKKQLIQEVAAVFKDLKVGDLIEVIAKDDISQAYEFTASQIRLLPTM